MRRLFHDRKDYMILDIPVPAASSPLPFWTCCMVQNHKNNESGVGVNLTRISLVLLGWEDALLLFVNKEPEGAELSPSCGAQLIHNAAGKVRRGLEQP